MPYRESDELVTFLAPEQGKRKALARGVKKVRSTLRAPLQPFCHSQIYLAQGKDLDTITQAAIIDFFPVLRDDFKLSLAALYVMELLDKGLADQEPAPAIFNLAVATLHYLAAEADPDIWLRYFELNLLARLGYRPELHKCIRCQQNQPLSLFSPAAGGMLCAECSRDHLATGSQSLSGEALGSMRLLLAGEPNACRRLKTSTVAGYEIEKAIESYWHYYVEQPLQMKKIYQKYPSKLNPFPG